MESITTEIQEALLIDKNIQSPEMNSVETKIRESVFQEVDRVQTLTRTLLPLDQLSIEYHDDDTFGSGLMVIGCHIEDGVRWGRLSAGKPPTPESKFLSTQHSADEMSGLAHELTHLITMEASKSVQYPIDAILSEGISIAIEVDSRNSGLTENKKINPENTRAHCQRIIDKNQDLFLKPENTIVPEIALNRDAIYHLTIEAENRMEYDGFAIKRDLVHLAGYSFVSTVLGPEIWKWPVLFKNPPTMEEIVQPLKYIQRVGNTLREFQIKEVQPVRPILNDDEAHKFRII